MYHPQFELKLGSNVVETTKNKSLISISVEQSLEMPADIFSATFSNEMSSIITKFKPGEEASVSLGYNEGIDKVFTGLIYSVEADAYTTVISSLSSMIKLCRSRVDLFFEQQTSGAIVTELIKSSGVETDEAGPADGIQFPYYAVDSNKNIYEHIKELARLNGFTTYMNNHDKLVFKKFDPKTIHTVEYGKEIVHLSRIHSSPQAASVAIFGESPSSVMGYDRAHWLTKNQVRADSKVEAPKGATLGINSALQLYNRSLKDDEAVSTTAESVSRRLGMVEVLDVRIPGNQRILLGDALKLKGAPAQSLNNNVYQIRDIIHSMNKRAGYTTTIRCIGPV